MLVRLVYLEVIILPFTHPYVFPKMFLMNYTGLYGCSEWLSGTFELWYFVACISLDFFFSFDDNYI